MAILTIEINLDNFIRPTESVDDYFDMQELGKCLGRTAALVEDGSMGFVIRDSKRNNVGGINIERVPGKEAY